MRFQIPRSESRSSTVPTRRRRTAAAIAAGLVLLLAAALLVPAAWAGPFGPGLRDGGPWDGGGALLERTVERLDLTDAQRQEIREILAAHRVEIRGGVQGVVEARRALFDTIHGDTFDEAAIRDAAATVAEAEADLAVLRGEVAHEVRAVLTPEQLAELEEIRSDVRALVETVVHRLRDRLETAGLG